MIRRVSCLPKNWFMIQAMIKTRRILLWAPLPHCKRCTYSGISCWYDFNTGIQGRPHPEVLEKNVATHKAESVLLCQLGLNLGSGPMQTARNPSCEWEDTPSLFPQTKIWHFLPLQQILTELALALRKRITKIFISHSATADFSKQHYTHCQFRTH